MTAPEDAMADKIESIAFWLEDDADRIHLIAAASLLRASQTRIANLERALALWQRRPDVGCDGKCADADCYCGYRKWDAERAALESNRIIGG